VTSREPLFNSFFVIPLIGFRHPGERRDPEFSMLDTGIRRHDELTGMTN